MNAPWTLLASAILGACVLAACGGGSGSNSTPVVGCTLPSGTQLSLAYPISGATGVPDSPGQVVIAASPPLPNTWQVVLQLPGGFVPEGVFNTIATASVPTPFATPGFANPTYQSSGLTGSLPSGTAIAVLLNNQASTCNAFPQIGTFTTQ